MIERAYEGAMGGALGPNARRDVDETAGQQAERLVRNRLRAALPERVTVLANVRWRQHGRVRG